MKDQDDEYSRVDYRRVVAWPERIRREAPFLLNVLADAPKRRLLDLGCGSGEHSRFLAEEGFRVVGVDRSAAMIEKAKESPLPTGVEFILGEIQDLAELTEGRFGAAVSLGNTLVHLREDEELERSFCGLSRVLETEGVFLFQILNYERIFSQGVRYLPLNFRPGERGEIVFLRLMELREGGRVRFCPSTLNYDPNADPPLQLVRSKLVELRGWRRDELVDHLTSSGFEVTGIYGDMQGGDYDPDHSGDLVVVARKAR